MTTKIKGSLLGQLRSLKPKEKAIFIKKNRLTYFLAKFTVQT